MGVTETIENWEFSIANFQSSRMANDRSSARSDMFIENDGLEKSHQLRRSGMSLSEPDRANMSNSMPLLRSKQTRRGIAWYRNLIEPKFRLGNAAFSRFL